MVATSSSELFFTYGMAMLLLLIPAIYCILMSKNLIRILIGVELMTKAVTLLLIVAGHANANIGLAQAFVVTMIVVEVVVIAVAAGIVIGTFYRTGSLDVRELNNLKG